MLKSLASARHRLTRPSRNISEVSLRWEDSFIARPARHFLRVHLLTFIEEDALYAKIGPVSANGGAADWNAQSTMPALFGCPSMGGYGAELTTSSYWGVSGVPGPNQVLGQPDGNWGQAATNGMLFPGSKTRFADIADGSSHSLALGERTYNFRSWMTGATWVGPPLSPITNRRIANESCNNAVYSINSSPELQGYWVGDNDRPAGTVADKPLADLYFGSAHPGGAQFCGADASVQFLSEDLELNVFRDAATINGD